mgnify:FL=1
MLVSPAIIALVACSAVICCVTLCAAAAGLAASVRWDPESSSRRQLQRERSWMLVEVSTRLVFTMQLLSLAVFVATADHLKSLFTGAMCAVGSLNANPLGTPTLALKCAVFILCGIWLVTNRAFVSAVSTALVRSRAVLLMLIAGLMIVENLVQIGYFCGLDPEIITSCCATVFDRSTEGIAGGLADLPVGWSRLVFVAGIVATAGAGLYAILRHRSTIAYSILAVVFGLVTVSAVVTWIAPSYYELPTHHCPLCLLSPDLGYVGFALYLSLASAVIAGLGSGLVRALRSLDRHDSIRAREERRLCAVSLICFAVVAAIAWWPLLASPFRLGGF